MQKKRKTKIGAKLLEVRVQKDLFGRILGISIDRKIDMAKIFTYPITPVSLSLCHFDGGICKTQKFILMKCLEKDVEHNPPSHIDIVEIDGFFLLHTMKNVPKTFGSISKKMLHMVMQSNAKRFDIIFNQYFSPSIKDYERSLPHESTQLGFNINRLDQVRPPENNGWILEDNQYHFNWFDEDQLPAFVSESLEDESEEDTKDDEEDNEDIQYQHWIDNEISSFNDDDNED
ncbi:hypothetical protein TNIN_145811 [Trichonephila inaurata madagascariensis]|uniref:Uncharacterized protein n=1 Tax=Trichonephila inaurata madagascariensis TaxID=2747483 RepID=A0A8X6Y993_9ARAC|nr:hypothetical protein TNIN_145811 [Trichonephila inaurata madagascariensis]